MSSMCVLFLLLISSLAMGRGEISLEGSIVRGDSCHYTDIQKFSRRSYVWFNILEQFSKKEIVGSRSDLLQRLEESIRETKSTCGGDSIFYEFERYVSFEIIQEGGRINIGFVPGVISASGNHSVEEISLYQVEKNNGRDRYFVYEKFYGNRKNEPLFIVKYRDKRKEYVRITGRVQGGRISEPLTFWFAGESHELLLESTAVGGAWKELKSLAKIYKSGEVAALAGDLKVGVIGTGLDYNNPGLARFLGLRRDLEVELIQREHNREKLKFHLYSTFEEYEEDVETNELFKVGFPVWMDQARRSGEPYDQIIYDGKAVFGANHETKVTSRIIEGLNDVEIFFARRDMGRVVDFNVAEVLQKFYDHGVRLINMSFGSACGFNLEEERTWDNLFQKYSDVTFVVSAGNSGFSAAAQPYCPAVYSTKYKNVISVTALNEEGTLAEYRQNRGGETYFQKVNYGVEIDLAIKADNLLVLEPGAVMLKWVNQRSGATSLAAAEVTNIILKAMEAGIQLEAQEIKETLKSRTVYDFRLNGIVSNSSYLDERVFLDALF